MKKIDSSDGVRYVGDRETMFVHDRWNRDSESCFLERLAENGRAVAFEPDTLAQAFDEGFDYCDECIGREEPEAPYASRSKSRQGAGSGHPPGGGRSPRSMSAASTANG